MLTLGTAHTFFLSKANVAVGNCHKRPAADFRQALLSVTEVTAALTAACGQVRAVNPGLSILLTVSPVRHVGASLEDNAVSKATLRLAVQQACQSLQGVQYSPAYELLLDDLRDYRFYADDLLHPSPMAETYIFEKFVQAAFTTEARQLLPRYQRYQRGLGHQPTHPDTAEHRAFLDFLEKEKAFFSDL